MPGRMKWGFTADGGVDSVGAWELEDVGRWLAAQGCAADVRARFHEQGIDGRASQILLATS